MRFPVLMMPSPPLADRAGEEGSTAGAQTMGRGVLQELKGPGLPFGRKVEGRTFPRSPSGVSGLGGASPPYHPGYRKLLSTELADELGPLPRTNEGRVR